MKVPKCKVVIKCDNKVMREFGTVEDLHESGGKVQCFIPSEPGKEFWIEYSHDIDHKFEDAELAVDVYFDNKFSGGWLAPDPQPRVKKVSGEIRGSRYGDKLRHFIFVEPEVIERETPSSTDVRFLGDITVQVGFVPKSECTKLESKPTVTDNGITRVNEKDKPPGAHCVTLKESSEKCAEPVFWSYTGKYALYFVFQCRSKEWLQAEGIMPKSRRRKGDLEPAGDSGTSFLPKLEPQEDVVPPRKRAKRDVGRGVKVEETERVKVEGLEPEMQTPKPGKKRAKVRR